MSQSTRKSTKWTENSEDSDQAEYPPSFISSLIRFFCDNVVLATQRAPKWMNWSDSWSIQVVVFQTQSSQANVINRIQYNTIKYNTIQQTLLK